MKNRDFKLLIEGFNRFLMKEEHTPDDPDDGIDKRLFDAIPPAFSDYINSQNNWVNGERYIKESDHLGDRDAASDERSLFKAVARACGCEVKDLLVHFDDNFKEEIEYGGGSLDEDDVDAFLDAYEDDADAVSKGQPRGSFKMGGSSLKGFYFRLGTDSAAYGLNFKSMMSERSLKGLLFVAPNCSGGASKESDSQSPSATAKNKNKNKMNNR